MMHWFRFWHGAISSPKVLRLSPRLRWGWIQMLCVASVNSERGTLPPTADLRFHLGMSEKKVRSIIDKLVEAGLIDCDGDSLRMHDWDEWQYESDSSTDRVRVYRARRNETVPKRFSNNGVTPPDTEAEPEQIRTDQRRKEHRPKRDDVYDYLEARLDRQKGTIGMN